GDAEDIAALDAIVRPFVFRRYLDFGVIDAIRNMHAQIRAEVNRQERLHPDRSNNVKLGRGGIREIEFLAQVFQLIRGGRDAALRDRSTRTTLRIIAEKGLLSHAIVYQLLASYTFLRNLEHRLQYLDDAQTHTLPANDADRLLGLVNLALPLIIQCSCETSGGNQQATLGRLLDFLETIARRSAYLSLLTEYPHALARVAVAQIIRLGLV
ncbi:MAG: hypothetical protein J0626_02920, partial [Rhodospirillaceae bacterium]|nr:hypothetical protein [Rhodospirillaceae bacterium]